MFSPVLVHLTPLVSFLLFRKNLGNLRQVFGHLVYAPFPPPTWQKIARARIY